VGDTFLFRVPRNFLSLIELKIMKIRDSGMPEEHLWSSFFNPQIILNKLGLTLHCGDVVDFGCGYGLFTAAAAQITPGIVYAFDIELDLIRSTEDKTAHFKNTRVIQRDFIAEGTGIKNDSIGYVMLFNILHLKNPLILLQEAQRILRPEGRVGVLHWNYDVNTPRGPSLNIRPRPELCQKWLTETKFKLRKSFVDLPPYHYGIVGQK